MTDSEQKSHEVSGSGVPERLLPLLHEREQYCDELLQLCGRGDDVSERRAAELADAYRRAEPLPPEYAEIIDRKFAEIQAKQKESAAAAREAAKLRARKITELEQRLKEHAELAAAEPLLPQREALKKLHKTIHALLGEISDLDTVKAVFAAAEAEVAERLAAEEVAEAAAREKIAAVIEAVTKLLEAEPEAFRQQRPELEVQRQEAEAVLNPKNPESAALLQQLKKLWKEANNRLTLHYQTLDLARWESYTLKMDLCKELETLQEVPDAEIPAVARRLREIRQKWQELGAVPREKQHDLGPRYYACTNHLQHRIDEYYKQHRIEQAAAAENKERLCAEAEALADSTHWNETTEKLKALQEEWKNAPRAAKELEDKLYKRFRAACNAFFNARTAYWKERDVHTHQIAGEKARLCEEAEKLAGLDFAAAAPKAKLLRAEFMKLARAGKTDAELNARFDAAMDKVFAARREELEAHIAAREAIVSELEAMIDAGASPFEAEKRLRELRNQYRELPPIPRDRAQSLESRARAAAGKLEKQLSEAKKQLERDRETLFVPALRELAAQLRAARAGEILPELAVNLEAFPRLAALANQLAAGSLPDNLDKQLNKNSREFNELLDQLDALANPEAPPVLDLAAELQAAIIGNSVPGGSARTQPENPEELRRRLLSLGLPQPDDLEGIIARLPAPDLAP